MHVMAGVEVIVPIVASRLRRLRPRRGKVDRAPDHRLARTFVTQRAVLANRSKQRQNHERSELENGHLWSVRG